MNKKIEDRKRKRVEEEERQKDADIDNHMGWILPNGLVSSPYLQTITSSHTMIPDNGVIREDVPLCLGDVVTFTENESDNISVTIDLDAIGWTPLVSPTVLEPPPGFAFKVMDNTIYILCSCWWCKLKRWVKGEEK